MEKVLPENNINTEEIYEVKEEVTNTVKDNVSKVNVNEIKDMTMIKIENLQDQGEATFDQINGMVKDLIEQQKQNPQVHEAKAKVIAAMAVSVNVGEEAREKAVAMGEEVSEKRLAISGQLNVPSNLDD
jgi:hypothetical protein